MYFFNKYISFKLATCSTAYCINYLFVENRSNNWIQICNFKAFKTFFVDQISNHILKTTNISMHFFLILYILKPFIQVAAIKIMTPLMLNNKTTYTHKHTNNTVEHQLFLKMLISPLFSFGTLTWTKRNPSPMPWVNHF